MPIASGINKIVSYKKETTFGVLPSASGAQTIRRVSSAFNLAKETYQSEEIRKDYQIADLRHGVRSVEGNVSGELSAGTYAMGYDNDVKVYDFCQEIGFSTYDIKNIGIIDEALDIDRSVYKVVNEFINSISQMIDKIDMNKIIDTLKETQNTINKENKGKVIAVKGKRKKE